MAKESFYFKHDYGARNDKKMVNLLKKEGLEGVGIYWCVVEMLYEEGGTLMLDDCEGIAFALRSHASRIKKVVCSYELFRNDGTKFWSESVNKRLQDREMIADRNRKNAQIGWEKKKHDATGMRPSTLIKGEERKEKEIKGEERIRNIGAGDFFVCIPSKYLNEKSLRIYDLSEYFTETQQMEQIKKSNWGAEKFPEFLKANPGRSFDDADHLYHALKKYCLEGSANGKQKAFEI